MDVPAVQWKEGVDYVVNDIVKLDNLEEGGMATGEEVIIDSSKEVPVGDLFKINSGLNYTIRAMARKGTSGSQTADPYKTSLSQKSYTGSELSKFSSSKATHLRIDPENSIGVGVGIKFYDSTSALRAKTGVSQIEEINSPDLRKTHRLMASSELSKSEYYNIQLYIREEDIPAQAVAAQLIVFVYGFKSGSFEFKQWAASNASKYFYCTRGHLSSVDTGPNRVLPEGSPWTQDFAWRPSYNSTAEFAALNESLPMGEGGEYITNLAINSLPMQLSLTFDNRTDKEARAIIHFLQEKFFPYESIFSLDYKGNRLLSTEVGYFNFKYTYPYKEDLKFTCTNFGHSKTYRNNNNIGATFVCNTQSILESVESHHGYNKRIDGLIPISLDKKTTFKDGIEIPLSTFSLGDDHTKSIDYTEFAGITYDEEFEGAPAGKLIFFEPFATDFLSVKDCIYVRVSDQYMASLGKEPSAFNVGLSKVIGKSDSGQEVWFGPLVEGGITDNVAPPADPNDNLFIVKRLNVCPEDCLQTIPLIPEDMTEVPSELPSGAVGREVYLKNYRKIRLDSDITPIASELKFTPIGDFTMDGDFQVLVPAVKGRSSIYIKNPDEFTKYPWLRLRNFEHKPSYAFTLDASPSHIQTNFIEYYKKNSKKEINQNLAKLSLVFEKRSDKEAAELLQFLEAHLGSKKFRFQLPEPYLKDDDPITTDARPYMSIFYCPSWTHSVVYKNNHTITASFMECATSREENLVNVFGIGRKSESPCYGAEIYDPITTYPLCTFSSILKMAFGNSFDLTNDGPQLSTQSKAIDIVLIIDGSGSMVFNYINAYGEIRSKYQIALDVVKKIVMAYDDYIVPGTVGWGTPPVFDAPPLTINGAFSTFVDSSGDDNVPPWPVAEDGHSWVQDFAEIANSPTNTQSLDEFLSLQGSAGSLYNTENLDRFKIKVDERRVNIGVVYMGNDRGKSLGECSNIIDISDAPKCYDKKFILEALSAAAARRTSGENYPYAISLALAQLYNSPRAETVTDRIVIMLSDGLSTNDAGATGSINKAPQSPGSGNYNQAAINMAAALRPGGALAIRRPTNTTLGHFGHGEFNPRLMLDQYLTQTRTRDESTGTESSAYRYADLGATNPSWYKDPMPTVFMFATVGSVGAISPHAQKYCFDYPKNPNKPQYFFPISKSGEEASELSRMLDLIRVVEIITTDSGYQNIFSLTLHNCGPHEVELLNSVINVSSQAAALKYTTEYLKSGIPKGGGGSNAMQYVGKFPNPNDPEKLDGKHFSFEQGLGGQFEGDDNNEGLFTFENVNLLWESFNTKYEVWREGMIGDVRGGWNSHQGISAGVNNWGVAFKGMPIRVFKAESGLEIVDYNIGNAKSSPYKGDYKNLPKLGPGESIDLFFGIRAGHLSNFLDDIQVVINSDDGTTKRMDCFGAIDFQLGIPIAGDSRSTLKVGPARIRKSADREKAHDELNPEASFTSSVTAGITPLEVTFSSDESSGGTSTITDYFWEFGDGSTSTEKNPTKVYEAVKSYTVSLTVITAVGKDTVVMNDYIIVDPQPVPPHANFFGAQVAYVNEPGGTGTPKRVRRGASRGAGIDGTSPLEVDFLNKSTAGTAPIISYLWDFGDGTTSTEGSPTHTYILKKEECECKKKNYGVSLTVTTDHGVDTLTMEDFVRVTAESTPKKVVEEKEEEEATKDVDQDMEYDESTQTWVPVKKVEDGSKVDKQEEEELVKEEEKEEEETKEDVDNQFHQTPLTPLTANFKASATSGQPCNYLSDSCTPLTVQFTDLSAFPESDPITSWKWTFGHISRHKNAPPGSKKSTSAQKNPKHTYERNGQFSVTLTVTNSTGSHQEIKYSYITIRQAILRSVPDFHAAPLDLPVTGPHSPPHKIYLFDDSKANSYKITEWKWDFGDGSPRSPLISKYGGLVGHTYKENGLYTVKLTIKFTLASGCYCADDDYSWAGGSADTLVDKCVENGCEQTYSTFTATETKVGYIAVGPIRNAPPSASKCYTKYDPATQRSIEVCEPDPTKQMQLKKKIADIPTDEDGRMLSFQISDRWIGGPNGEGSDVGTAMFQADEKSHFGNGEKDYIVPGSLGYRHSKIVPIPTEGISDWYQFCQKWAPDGSKYSGGPNTLWDPPSASKGWAGESMFDPNTSKGASIDGQCAQYARASQKVIQGIVIPPGWQMVVYFSWYWGQSWKNPQAHTIGKYGGEEIPLGPYIAQWFDGPCIINSSYLDENITLDWSLLLEMRKFQFTQKGMTLPGPSGKGAYPVFRAGEVADLVVPTTAVNNIESIRKSLKASASQNPYYSSYTVYHNDCGISYSRPGGVYNCPDKSSFGVIPPCGGIEPGLDYQSRYVRRAPAKPGDRVGALTDYSPYLGKAYDITECGGCGYRVQAKNALNFGGISSGKNICEKSWRTWAKEMRAQGKWVDRYGNWKQRGAMRWWYQYGFLSSPNLMLWEKLHPKSSMGQQLKSATGGVEVGGSVKFNKIKMPPISRVFLKNPPPPPNP